MISKTYDIMGRLTKMTYPDGSYEQWTYDSAGRRATSRTRAGQVMTSTYNARGFEDYREWSDNTPDVQFQYEANGRLLYAWQTDAANSRYTTLYYEYDAANRMVREQLDLQDPAILGGSYGAATYYGYDADGNRASLTSPAGEVYYTYTQRNQPKEVLHFTDVLATYHYNADDTLATKSLLNGTTASYTHDAAGQLTTVNHTGPGAVPLKRRDYLYNNMGNRQQVIVTGGGAPGTTSYATANSVNQYPGIGGNPLTYDANGNLTAMQNAATPSSPITASYDAQNRLLSATRGSGGSADTMEVVYDPWNRPIYRVINGQKLFYVWDGWDLVGERTEAQYQVGEYERVYVHGAAVDEPSRGIGGEMDGGAAEARRADEQVVRIRQILTMQQGYGGARKFHHHDALGSVIGLTDDTGALIESYTYDVFGKAQVFDVTGLPVAATQHGNRFLYTGREYIAELSLYDYRNRVYSAEIGRFLQTDSIGFAAGDVNLYGYVGNSSVRLRDPFGLAPSADDPNPNPPPNESPPPLPGSPANPGKIPPDGPPSNPFLPRPGDPQGPPIFDPPLPPNIPIGPPWVPIYDPWSPVGPPQSPPAPPSYPTDPPSPGPMPVSDPCVPQK